MNVAGALRIPARLPPRPALRPTDVEELAAGLAEASAAGASVRVVGGGTRSRVGRPEPADREVRTGGLRRVVAHEPADLTVTVEAGLPVTELVDLLAAEGQAWPQADVRPGSTVGGVLAAGAGARARARYGPVRDSLLEVVLVTGDGRVVTAGGRTVKNVSGYDLPRLVVGSLGTLGVIAQVTLKLWPVPVARGWFALPAEPAEQAARAGELMGGALRPAAVVLTPRRLLLELAGPPEDVRAPSGFTPADEPPPAAWPGTVTVGVHPPALPALVAGLAAAGLDYEALYGVGVARVGVAEVEQLGRVRAAVEAHGGHAVVTDGDDALRADPWGAPPAGLVLMRRLRAAFDPQGILNPGAFVGGDE